MNGKILWYHSRDGQFTVWWGLNGYAQGRTFRSLRQAKRFARAKTREVGATSDVWIERTSDAQPR